MKKLTIAGLVIILLSAGFYFYACRNNDLRGWWRESYDGKTYLVIEDDGGSMNTPLMLDGLPWSHRAGERGEIEPGCHDLDKIGYCVKPGTEYHFDYWGP